MVPVFASALFIAGCAKTPPPAEPVPPPAAVVEKKAAEPKVESAQDVAKEIIVAKVNDAKLDMNAYITMLNRLPDKGGPVPETMDERKLRALDALVLRELAYQRAVAQGLVADPPNVEIAFRNFKDNLGGNEEYTDYLAKRNMTESGLRAEIERELTIDLIHTREVTDKIIIPEEDLKREYEKEKKYYITVEKTKVIDVFLIKNEGKASQKKAKELLKKIKADPSHDPWKLVLDGSFIVRHLSAHKERNKEIYETAKKMKPGDLSGAVRDATGNLHIIKLVEYIPERPLTYDEAKEILEEKMKAPFQDKKTQEWEQGLRKDAKIELMLDKVGLQEQKKTEAGQTGQK
jgi:peptidyl-prolyl cis-trans isomerase C